MRPQIALIILDGWGYRTEKEYNAIVEAETPFFDRLWAGFPHTLLEASGEAVGLPAGQMGTSEVGHLTIGAGRKIDADLVRISKAAAENKFTSNPAFCQLFSHVKKYNSTLHIQGLVGPGGVHSHSDHLFAFLKTAKAAGVAKIAIDVFTDGRDTPPQSAAKYLKELEDFIKDLEIGFIATASGRFYAMDRDNNWDRLEKAEKAIFDCQGKICKNRQPSEVIAELYKTGAVDEHLEPIIFLDDKDDAYPVRNNDGVLFFNFRADRAKMLSKKIMSQVKEKNLYFVTMTDYGQEIDSVVAFPPEKIETILAEQISLAKLSQAHIAETEKFAHATYYLNGGRQNSYPGETDIIVESRKDVKTHDQAPKMKAKEVADKAIEQINGGTDFIFVNFANADMVGHTANREALIEAVEEVDFQADRIVDAILQKNGLAIISADHGNAEIYYDIVNDAKHTAHTASLVPFIITKAGAKLKDKGSLADITPTILDLFNIKKPDSMTGESLLIKNDI